MATNATPTPKPSLPNFPCPKCGEDLLSSGFYNSCSETQRLREDNYPLVVGDKLYLEHNEDNYETTDHECDVDVVLYLLRLTPALGPLRDPGRTRRHHPL